MLLGIAGRQGPLSLRHKVCSTVPAFRLACLAYFSTALPGSTLGLLWPSIRFSFHQPVATLGILLVCAIAASVVASATTGRLLSRVSAGSLVALSTMLTALALATESLSSSLWVFAGGMMLFGLGFGALDAALNAYAAHHFGARQINWMHASYGLGAAIGPALATTMLSNTLSWRWVYGSMGMAQVILAVLFTMTASVWVAFPPALAAASTPHPVKRAPQPSRHAERRRPPSMVVMGSLAFTAVEAGIESGAGIWGYVFLTEGRGFSHTAAGGIVSAYWAMMFVGRVVLGGVAERLGAPRVLGAAVVGVGAGTALMAVPSPGLVAAVGMIIVGLAAAPVFPLFTLTTAQRLGTSDASGTTRTVSLQVAASAIGSAALPAGIGVAIGYFTATALAPPLLLLSLTMCALYGLLSGFTLNRIGSDRARTAASHGDIPPCT
jgi:fucose permease